MNELIDRIVTQAGVDRTTAEKSVGIILEFLSREGPADKVRALLARLPGHASMIAEHGGGSREMEGIMGVGMRLMSAGLGMNQIQTVVHVLMAYCRDMGAGDDLREIGASIPGLSQFM
jgi:hypothetical protein